MKAYAYLRVSGRGQVEGDGFKRQKQVIRDYAEKHGIEILQTFQEEGVSGTTDEKERPAFQEMVATILRNGAKTVIIEGLDRLAREYRIQETLLIYLASKDIDLIAARTEENVTEAVKADPMRKALIQIQGVFSELEKNLLVKKLRTARERKKAETGKCEGRKTFKEKAPEVLREMRRLRRKRKGVKRIPYAKIAEELNRQGHTNTNGKQFTGNTVLKILQSQRR